jgi:hypothetical protein
MAVRIAVVMRSPVLERIARSSCRRLHGAGFSVNIQMWITKRRPSSNAFLMIAWKHHTGHPVIYIG